MHSCTLIAVVVVMAMLVAFAGARAEPFLIAPYYDDPYPRALERARERFQEPMLYDRSYKYPTYSRVLAWDENEACISYPAAVWCR